MASDKVKVAVRVRPFNRREMDLSTKCVVEMSEQQTILNHPSSTKGEHCRKPPKTFAFDSCLWSFNEQDDHYACQETVFRELGDDILSNAFQGYNACIFAYGQTGSGKSFTMMGSEDNKGLIPRLCDSLFEKIASNPDPTASYKVEVSYMEIYNERVHDLLDPKGSKQNLKVREHNILGPYVDGLSTLAVDSYEAIDNLMGEGNKSRTVAATNMNSESSRSHAVFNIILTCSITDLQSGVTGEKASKMSLVDLAGSERAVKTGAVGERLKEGSNINKSLTTLGLVISKLADQSAGKTKDNKFVPYRDSVLTWLLKDNLGGNSKTVMVATISPAADNYEETLSTLRYADRAKRIVNHAVINEDPNARIIRELREEVEMLREQLKHAAQQDVLKERLVESEKLMQEMSQTWEEKLSKTEKIHHERQQALEKMGISVQASGIKVEQDKYYLVNLNADPSLNELLVYYLKDLTLIGRSKAPREQDIQLSGLGIMPEHCLISIENFEIYVWPIEGARTCVNGSVITEKNQLKHGDRLLWGNNHFFRVNCPKTASPNTASTPERPIDYEFAREELMMNELSNDPIQNAMKTLEKQHEEDKHNALEKQRQMYEKQLQMLRNQMSPSTPYAPYSMGTFDPLGIIGKNMTPTGLPSPSVQSRMDKWAKERDELFRKSLAKLREDIVRANGLVREANFLSDEMGKRTEFKVTLQIPAANLSPNRKKGAFVSEPAILVKRKNKGSQVWSMEKLENKLIDMREMYEEKKEKSFLMGSEEAATKSLDPFYESQENHNLIGVANIFLEVLFHDVKLNYQVPIISQQGEVAGRLHVELCRVQGSIPERLDSSTIDISEDSEDVTVGRQVSVRVAIKAAAGLPPSLSNFVFCQYSFWAYPDAIVVPPIVNPEYPPTRKGKENIAFKFDHVKEFTLNVNEEFIEHCAEGALSIEVWGHRSAGFSSAKPGWEVDAQLQRSRSLADRWAELTRKIELWVDILEINDNGEYAPVEVVSKPDTLTGGIYQLRQGQQRRVVVRVQPVSNSGTLPIICEAITSVAIGCICSRVKLQKALDSYQEEDLSLLREKWSEALMRRREYLDEQIQKMINKQDKSEEDIEREQSLIDSWVCLTEERNAVLVPAPGSGIPGAPADWDPQSGMEHHIPVIFLDLNADDMGVPVGEENEGVHVAGTNSILPKEHGSKLYNLPILKHYEKDVCAVAAWDSSIHDSILLNRATPPNERVYLILKASIRLTHPATMDLILRKRLSINVYKKQSIAERIKKKIVWQDSLQSTGVTYEVVANIPKASEDPEDREALALMAASGEDSATSDGESYIEKYTRGVSAVESILTLDRLRQEVAVKELLAAHGRPLRKTASVPNIAQIIRMEASPSSKLDEHLRSDSVHDLSSHSFDSLERLRRGSNSLFEAAKSQVALLAKETSPLSSMSPASQPTKLVKPMRTLLEEINNCQGKPLLEKDESEESAAEDESFNKKISKNVPIEATAEYSEKEEDEFTEFESYRPTGLEDSTIEMDSGKHPDDNVLENSQEEQQNANSEFDGTSLMKHSGTCDSLLGYQSSNKVGTPSIVSSGYGSQGMSATPSEDSYSLRSIGALLDVMTPEAIDPSRLHNGYMGSESILDKEVFSEIPISSVMNPTKTLVESPIVEAHSNDSIPEEVEDENVEEQKYTVEMRQNRASINQFVSHRASYPSTSTNSSSFVKPSNEQVEMRARLGELNLLKNDVDKRQPNSEEENENEHENCSENSHQGGEDPGTDQEDSTSVSSFGSKADLHSSVGDVSLPSWLVVGESVAISPYNKRGTVAYLGNTHFSPGVWAGIELDTPTGKNDGTVNGFRYFQCKPRFGIFVRPDKLQLDKRGREIRAARQSMSAGDGALRRSRSKGEGLSCSYVDLSGSRLSRSRGEGLSTLGLNHSTMPRSRSRGDGLQSKMSAHDSSEGPIKRSQSRGNLARK